MDLDESYVQSHTEHHHQADNGCACVCSISKDLVPFDVPVTFTIQVHDPHTDEAGFLRYAQRINNLTEAEYYTILTGIIHGQTRILAGEHRRPAPLS